MAGLFGLDSLQSLLPTAQAAPRATPVPPVNQPAAAPVMTTPAPAAPPVPQTSWSQAIFGQPAVAAGNAAATQLASGDTAAGVGSAIRAGVAGVGNVINGPGPNPVSLVAQFGHDLAATYHQAGMDAVNFRRGLFGGTGAPATAPAVVTPAAADPAAVVPAKGAGMPAFGSPAYIEQGNAQRAQLAAIDRPAAVAPTAQAVQATKQEQLATALSHLPRYLLPQVASILQQGTAETPQRQLTAINQKMYEQDMANASKAGDPAKQQLAEQAAQQAQYTRLLQQTGGIANAIQAQAYKPPGAAGMPGVIN